MTQTSLSRHTPLSTFLTSDVHYQMGCSVLSKESAMNIEKALKEKNLPEMVSLVRGTLKTASRSPASIAVTGDSGNGMSSFINALRRIGHEEEDSAPTGIVRTTEIPTCYCFSQNPDVVLWDLPGTGATTTGSLENYLKEMQFHLYDLIIIIASEQFSMNLVKLAKFFHELGKKFYIVWTKLDRDLSTRIHPEEQLLQNIRDNIRETLQKEGVCEPIIFLVSSFYPLLHDFPELRDTLHKDISDIRHRGPLENISHICEKVINDKVTTLQGEIGSASLQNLGIQNADDPQECLYAYHLLFGVDDKSLKQVTQSLGKPMEEYKATMKSQDLHTVLTADWVLSWMNCNTASYFYSILSYVPIIGNPSVHYLRWWKQGRLLELVAEDTKTILGKVLRDSII